MTDKLTPQQIEALGRYKIGLHKVLDATLKLNEFAKEQGFDIRELPVYPFGLSMSDAEHMARRHFTEVEAERAAAIERMEKVAA